MHEMNQYHKCNHNNRTRMMYILYSYSYIKMQFPKHNKVLQATLAINPDMNVITFLRNG